MHLVISGITNRHPYSITVLASDCENIPALERLVFYLLLFLWGDEGMMKRVQIEL